MPYSSDELFQLVNDVDSYPRFLPWCRSAESNQISDEEVLASVEIYRVGLHRTFTTRNRLHPPSAIHMTLESGPFRHLEGDWTFRSLADSGCRVSLDLEFAFASRLLDAVFAPIFSEVMSSLIDAFVKEARRLHCQ